MSAPVVTQAEIAKDGADWLLAAVATATQERRFLRGDPQYDECAGEVILLNGEKAILVALLRAEAAFREREEGLVAALERAAEVFDWLTENQPDCYGWHAPYPSVEPAIKLEADEIRAILARAKATSEVPHA